MALRDQPYLPLYVQDFLTDEKLAECSAQATGVYIRIMCLMHKSEQYGRILLKQKHKQTDEQILNFASMLAKHFPYDVAVIKSSLLELLDEGVLKIEDDLLIQKRMVKDYETSVKRAMSGKKGGQNSLGKHQDFAQAKSKANTENEIEYENDNKDDIKGVQGENGILPVEPKKPKADPDQIMLSKIDITDEYKETFLKWLKYKRKRQQSYKDEDSTQLAFNQLKKLSGNDHEKALKIVEKSMANNWAGLFELKEEKLNTKNNGHRHREVSCVPGDNRGVTTID